MNAARVLENADVQLPADIAERLSAKPGDMLAVEPHADGTVWLYPDAFGRDDVFGCFACRTTVTAIVEEMDESIADACQKDQIQDGAGS